MISVGPAHVEPASSHQDHPSRGTVHPGLLRFVPGSVRPIAHYGRVIASRGSKMVLPFLLARKRLPIS